MRIRVWAYPSAVALLLAATMTTSHAATTAKTSPGSKSGTAVAKPGAHAAVLPFIKDDYEKALAEAKARNLPLFVEAWAPWCHTCRSMKAFVFTDAALAAQKDRFVWLEIDTEKAKNAAVRRKLNIPALPSFFVLDPKDERVALRWTGGATTMQMLKILDDGVLAVNAAASSEGRDAALARADRAYATADYATAAVAYGEATAAAPADWAPYGSAVESRLFALQSIDSCEAVTRTATEAWPRLARTSSAANLSASGLSCALELPKENAGRAALIARFEKDARGVLADPSITLADDDRSAIYGTLVDVAEDRGDEAAAKQAAADWGTFLDGAATRAASVDQATVFDSHRLSAWIAAGQPERAIGFLTEHEKALPDDYNPPARLANAYRAMKKWDEGLAASDRALAKNAYGPRRLLLLQTRADLYAGKGDEASRRKTIEQAIAEAEAFPPGQRNENTIASLKKKLDPPKP